MNPLSYYNYLSSVVDDAPSVGGLLYDTFSADGEAIDEVEHGVG